MVKQSIISPLRVTFAWNKQNEKGQIFLTSNLVKSADEESIPKLSVFHSAITRTDVQDSIKPFSQPKCITTFFGLLSLSYLFLVFFFFFFKSHVHNGNFQIYILSKWRRYYASQVISPSGDEHGQHPDGTSPQFSLPSIYKPNWRYRVSSFVFKWCITDLLRYESKAIKVTIHLNVYPSWFLASLQNWTAITTNLFWNSCITSQRNSISITRISPFSPPQATTNLLFCV